MRHVGYLPRGQTGSVSSVAAARTGVAVHREGVAVHQEGVVVHQAKSWSPGWSSGFTRPGSPAASGTPAG
ncbi:hypothetical protein STRIP9103_08288 [Streptomyces ipomoeae 91-03]|uniref:Uncharacterized protein n=1 Tax=Streptomyces ipomoeae 91-03 TaxID=698759 RepID=L1KGX1_9ACTN|nr:hypothetical protein STRIP9103_08288 [Streptomyces ipomoeae 91-03]